METFAFADSGQPLRQLPASSQVLYLLDYLAELRASTVVHEPSYFDRDYLAEFGAFYSQSTAGYQNTCQREHFFNGDAFDMSLVKAALGGDAAARQRLQESYLGFVVLRPISATLGRTVLRWYDEHTPATPRVTTPSRTYKVHLAGLELEVQGLAWQQQDGAVSACATVALWSMLHSSAFTEYHAIPTTARLTQLAHSATSLDPSGARVFPAASGLQLHQMLEAIKQCGLAPAVVEGSEKGFGRERFSAAIAALLRAGYPVLIVVDMLRSSDIAGHAVCAVGFREVAAASSPGTSRSQDENIGFVYIHDDNIGPNARFEITTLPDGRTALIRSPPDPVPGVTLSPLRSRPYPTLVPRFLVVGVHEEVRMSPDALNKEALRVADRFRQIAATKDPSFSTTYSARFVQLPQYLDSLLPGRITNPADLATVRLGLAAKKASLHVGLVRVVSGESILFDIVYDTSEGDRHLRRLARIPFAPHVSRLWTLAGDNDGEVFDTFAPKPSTPSAEPPTGLTNPGVQD